MPNRIDYPFISEREGGCATKGYVPAAQASRSGVTIATGFDVGARNESDLKKLGLSFETIKKLKPYLGTKGVSAKNLLEKSPLTLSLEQAQSIDLAVKKDAVDQLALRYLSSAHNVDKVDFFSLPAQAQTAIASVSFQYGNLSVSAPKFWKAASSQDWKEAAKILRNFGDAYPSRRKLEAALLEEIAQ